MAHSTFKDSDMMQTGAEELVGAAAGGDQDAWNALVDRYAALVWSVIRAHRLSGADAADVSQTTWLRLVEHLHGLKDPARVGAWLATTARRECLRTLRQTARQIPFGEDMPEPPCTEPELDAELLRRERDAELWDAFGRLPQRDQALLRMLVSEPAPSYEEIAASLGMPIGSIGPTRARSLARLQRERQLATATCLAA